MWVEQTSTFTHSPGKNRVQKSHASRLHDVQLKNRIVELRHLESERLIASQNHSLSIFFAVLHQINISFASQNFRIDNIVWALFMVILKSLLWTHDPTQKRGHNSNGSVKVFYPSPFQTLKRANRYSPHTHTQSQQSFGLGFWCALFLLIKCWHF